MFGYVCWALLAANLAACAGLMARGVPAPAVVRLPALAVPTIPLPGEASVTAARPGTGPARTGSPHPTGGWGECMVAGPVDGLRDTLALAARVEATGARAEVREGRVQGRPDYMVHIEAAASRDAARRTLRELQGQSIDGYVVADGALENAVTVGVFSEPEPAEALLARVVELGYPARQKTLERAHSVYVILSDGGALGGVTGFPRSPCDVALRVQGAGPAAPRFDAASR